MIIVLISRSNIGGREVSAMEQFFIWYYYNYSVRFFNNIQGISIILIIWIGCKNNHQLKFILFSKNIFYFRIKHMSFSTNCVCYANELSALQEWHGEGEKNKNEKLDRRQAREERVGREGNISLACGRRESGSRAFGGPQVVCSFGMCSLSRTQIFPASVTSLHSDRTVVGSVFVCISCSCHF